MHTSEDFICDLKVLSDLGTTMTGETFKFPTVKKVFFEARFSNLFSMENKIGEFQEKIIEKFPESNMATRRQMFFADIGPNTKVPNFEEQFSNETGTKIWIFKSDDDQEINVTSSSLSITSGKHKTYNNPGEKKKFRDVIEFVMKSFFDVITIPKLKRVGLRYLDKCPLPLKNNETYENYYNGGFPIKKYSLKDASTFLFEVRTKKHNHNLVYQEQMVKEKDSHILILNFDGFALEVPSKDCMQTVDELHTIIEKEYLNLIKEPFKEYIRIGVINE